MKTLLLTLGILAIPLWYFYRSFEDKRVRHLEWSEVFMTEEARQQKWAEEKKKAQEQEAAKKVEADTKKAEAEAKAEREKKDRLKAQIEEEEARARGLQIQKEREEQQARARLSEERIKAEAAANRARLEAEHLTRQQAVSAALRACAEKASTAEAGRVRVQRDQRTFQAFYEEASRVSLPDDPPPPRTLEEALRRSREIQRADFAQAFQMLSGRQAMRVFDEETLKMAKQNCDANTTHAADERPYEFESALYQLDKLNSEYSEASETLRRTRTDLADLIDYAQAKLGSSVADEVRRVRARQTLARARDWKEKP